MFHWGHATGDIFDLNIRTFCTASSDPESDFKAGRMKSRRTPSASGDKVYVEIPLSFPSSKNISSYMRGETILGSSEIQFLEQAHLLHVQQRADFSTLDWDQVFVPSFLLYTGALLLFSCMQDLGSLSWRYSQSVDERKILSCTLHCSIRIQNKTDASCKHCRTFIITR